MHDPAPRRGPETAQEWWFVVIFALILFSLLGYEIVDDYTPGKLSALLIIALWAPLLVLHEAGHAVMAHLLGWYVGQVSLGMGRVLGRFRLGTASVEIRPLPIEGFVRCVPRNLNCPHLKSALIYFAGPGVELLLAGVVLFVVGLDEMFTRRDDYGLICCQSLVVAAATQGVLNLMPHVLVTADGELVSDGLGIIRSFRYPLEYYAELMGQSYDERKQTWERFDPEQWYERDE